MYRWIQKAETDRWLAVILCYLMVFLGAPPVWGQDVSSIELAVETGMNRENTDVSTWEIAVSVQDNNGRKLKGAAVVFQIPPGYGTFAGGATSMTLITDENGRAVARGYRRGALSGPFQIAVTASYKGVSTSLGITQVNPKPAFWATPKKWYVIGAAGVAVAAGVGIWQGTRSSDPTRVTLGPATVRPVR